MRKTQIKIFISIAFFLFSRFAHAASLQLNYPGIPENLGQTPPLPVFVVFLFQLFLIITALIVFVVTITAGLKYVTSFGKPQVLKEAKDDIISAFLGFLILLSSWTILNSINPGLTALKLPLYNFSTSSIPTPDQPPRSNEEYLAIPVGQILDFYFYSKQGIKNFAETLSPLKNIENTRQKILTLSGELLQEMKNCQCKVPTCSQNCPCYAQIEKTACNTARMQDLADEIQTEIEQLEEKKKEFKINFTKLETAAHAVKTAYALQSLAGPSETLTYYDYVGIRETSGKWEYSADTGPFTEWAQPYANNISDPFSFYIKKQGAEKLFESVLSGEEGSLDIDEKTIPESEPSDSDNGTIDPQPVSDQDETPIVKYDYPFFSQHDGPWGNCCRRLSGCVGSIVYLGKTGCADTAVSMAIAYWYSNNETTKAQWLQMLKSDPPPSSMNSASSRNTFCYNKFQNNPSPDPYKVIYYMNNTGANLSDANWSLPKMKSFLNSLNLEFDRVISLDYAAAKDIVSTNKSIILFCDLYPGNGRDCSGGKGNGTCNHYVLAKGIDKNGNLLIHNPALSADNFPSVLSQTTYQNWGCGQAYGSQEGNFIIYPK